MLVKISALQGDAGYDPVDAIFLEEINPPDPILLIQARTDGF